LELKVACIERIRQQNTILTQKNKIILIIGSRKEFQVKDNLACLEFVLSDDQMQRLNEISKIELGFPQDFLNSEMIKDIIYGGTYSSMVLKKSEAGPIILRHKWHMV
jgi:hypothetical protein